MLSTYGRVESAEMANDNNNSANLPEKIKEDMRKSGFPLEFHVLNVCSTKNTGRMPGLRYEFQRERELDLLAFFEEISTGGPHLRRAFRRKCGEPVPSTSAKMLLLQLDLLLSFPPRCMSLSETGGPPAPPPS